MVETLKMKEAKVVMPICVGSTGCVSGSLPVIRK